MKLLGPEIIGVPVIFPETEVTENNTSIWTVLFFISFNLNFLRGNNLNEVRNPMRVEAFDLTISVNSALCNFDV
jgi:hypothetical protein